MKHPVAEANEESPFGSLTPDEFYSHHSVSHSSEFITNSRGLNLFTQWWTPLLLPPAKLAGVVCVVHGFTGESSWFVQLTAVHIAKHGFAVCAIDHQGHGFSDGLVAHLPDLNLVVDDCIAFFDSFRERHAPPGLPSFLYAESLGGAIALLITLRQGDSAPRRTFDGVVLNGAMCGISDKFKPPWPLEYLLDIAAALIPTWAVVPTRGKLVEVAFKLDSSPLASTALTEVAAPLHDRGVVGLSLGAAGFLPLTGNPLEAALTYNPVKRQRWLGVVEPQN